MMKISKNGSFPRALNSQGVGTVAIRLSLEKTFRIIKKIYFKLSKSK